MLSTNMACFGRQLLRSLEFSKRFGYISDFVEQLSANNNATEIQGNRVVADLVKLIYVADGEEVSLITDMLNKLYCSQAQVQQDCSPFMAQNHKLMAEGPLSPRRFQFGPLLFRLLYTLEDPLTAQSLYRDKDLNFLFGSTTCHLLLMDMLYEEGKYQQVVDAFTALQCSGVSARFTPDCTTVAMAALYHLNSPESCLEMKRLVDEAKAEGSTLSRRCLLFASALALRQGDALFALNIAQPLISSKEAVFRNIKVQSVANQFATTGNSELEARLEQIVFFLDTEGLLSPQTVDHFINRPILRQRNAKVSQSFKTRLKSPLKMKYT